MPGYSVTWVDHGDATLIVIGRGSVPLIACGLAWGPRDASSLWESLVGLAKPLPLSPEALVHAPMPRLPWLGAAPLPWMADVGRDDAGRLGSFEGCLGLSLLRHRLEVN